MKAVIVEIKDNVAAVLSEDGRVSKIKNKNYAIGQEVTLKNNNKYIKFAASAAAVLALLVTPAWAYLTPYSYVSLDINPSFEFSINRFNRVLKVKAVNDDGEKVVEKISVANLKNKEINEAVKNVIIELKDQGYIIEGKEGGVVVAASSKNQQKTDELAASLKTAVEEEVTFEVEKEDKVKQDNKDNKDKKDKNDVKEEIKEIEKTTETGSNKEATKVEDDKKIKEPKIDVKKDIKEAAKEKEKEDKEAAKEIKNNKKANFAVEVIEVSKNDVDEAKEHNVTPGKWNLVEKLQESSGYTFEEDEFQKWLNKPVKDIMDAINENKKSDNQEIKQECKEDKKEVKKEDKKEEKDKKDKKDKKEEKSKK